MADIINADTEGDILNGQAAFTEKFLGMGDAAVDNVLVNTGTHAAGKLPGQMMFADVHLPGDFL